MIRQKRSFCHSVYLQGPNRGSFFEIDPVFQTRGWSWQSIFPISEKYPRPRSPSMLNPFALILIFSNETTETRALDNGIKMK